MEKEFAHENQYSFIGDIDDLYRLHYITKNYDHFIEYPRGAWKLFEPSKFIYAYFSFNCFYNFDWEASIKNKMLMSFTKILREGREEEPSEGSKFKAMIDFVFHKIDDSDKEIFFKIIKGGAEIEELIEIISKITPDNRITESEKKNFQREFEGLLRSNDIRIGKMKNDIVRFVFLVRNNIFHGTKDTIEMSEIFQRKRLEIYTNIIIAVNELLFRILEKETYFRHRDNYQLKLNL